MSTEGIVQGIKDKMYYNGELNHIQLIEQTSFVTQVASLLLGIITTAILILIPIVVALEIMYITFPIIRQKTDELILGIESRGYKHNALGFVLRDAIEAVKRANTNMIGEKTAIAIYLQIKSKSLFTAMFIVAFVIKGGSTVVDFVWGLFESIISNIFY